MRVEVRKIFSLAIIYQFCFLWFLLLSIYILSLIKKIEKINIVILKAGSVFNGLCVGAGIAKQPSHLFLLPSNNMKEYRFSLQPLFL